MPYSNEQKIEIGDIVELTNPIALDYHLPIGQSRQCEVIKVHFTGMFVTVKLADHRKVTVFPEQLKFISRKPNNKKE